MSTLSTEPMRKRDVVTRHLRQLLRLLIISRLVAMECWLYFAMERAGIKARTVFEVETGEHHH